ncbi:retrovirus-related Pol polyprotein from transposon 297 [Nephila pilipes]|uniref:Retrovirus-related Pol polyprotein from transposon 297 n=1 Tax=Nephila pilipes TaxID=299642 RepID=A0A8X6Q297_NEPPI|nr:retrovirus-related Pol polyprotein from transposon 297 [Nephila pilipes]
MVQPNGEPIHCSRNYDRDHKISLRYFRVTVRRIGHSRGYHSESSCKEVIYIALRNRLCLQYADSEEQRLRDLISGMQLGDRKPSRLLLEMRSKAGNRLTEELL